MNKNYKKIIVIALIIGMTFIVGEKIKQNQIDGSQVLVEAFAKTPFAIEETDLNIWGEYLPKYMSEEEMKQIVEEIATKLGIDNYECVKKENETSRSYEINKKVSNASTIIKLVEVIEHVEEDTYKAKNYIVVNIVLKDKCDSINYFEQVITNYLENIDVKPVTSLVVKGSQKGKISETSSKNSMNNIVEELNADVKDSFYYSDIKSVYGYTEYVDNYVLSENEKINMDLAITYNDIEDKTYLYAAIPVITIDY